MSITGHWFVIIMGFPTETKWWSGAAPLYFCPKAFDVVEGMHKGCKKPLMFHHNGPKVPLDVYSKSKVLVATVNHAALYAFASDSVARRCKPTVIIILISP